MYLSYNGWKCGKYNSFTIQISCKKGYWIMLRSNLTDQILDLLFNDHEFESSQDY